MKLIVRVHYASVSADLPRRAAIARWARAALAGYRRRRTELCVRIVDEPEGARLNRRYRGKRRATNVLSFPFEDPPGLRSAILGDIVICAPVVAREARTHGRPARAHWAHMLVHAIMHLRGYDHGTPEQAMIMQNMECRALRRLGFRDPYAQG